MQSVIGDFDSMWAAQQAVRQLEQRNVSIQDVVIADRSQRTWRKLRSSGEGDGQFLVLMIADPPEIERARDLFSPIARREERARDDGSLARP